VITGPYSAVSRKLEPGAKVKIESDDEDGETTVVASSE
jgi:hypothetical protein